MSEPSRIVELRIRNVKRIRAAHITPTGNLIQITGKNGQGKTTVLDSIMYDFGGEKTIPEEALRRGAISGEVVADIGTHVVTRKFTEGGKSTIAVLDKSGKPVPSPQAWLNSLVGNIAFDPLAFSRQDPKEQAAVLRRVLGLDEAFKALDAKAEALATDRTATNRLLKSGEARLAALPVVDAPEKEVDMAELAEEHAAAMLVRSDNEEKRRWLADARVSRDKWETRIAQLEAQLADAKQNCEQIRRGIYDNQEAIEALVDPDLSAITERMRTVQATNAKVVAKRDRNKLQYEVLGLKDKSEAQTADLDKIAAEKAELVGKAKMPVAGMAFTADGVTLGGIAIAECSGAERLRASVAVGLAQNPKLRIMLIRDGSLLDSESMKALEQIAADRDAQVWIERVDESGEVGVVIEDGAIAGEGA